jgi:prepilin-type N-terminal cleavage/methylation domain-containing protein
MNKPHPRATTPAFPKSKALRSVCPFPVVHWNPRQSRGNNANVSVAFTLVELLVVISIIGTLAGLVVGLAGLASRKSKETRVRGELNQYITAIETYKLEHGFYPPDNARTVENPIYARTNQLFYELAGAVFKTDGKRPPSAVFQVVNKNTQISPSTLSNYFGTTGIANSARDKRDIKFQSLHFKEGQYKTLAGANAVDILVVPTKGPLEIPGANGDKLNPWLYDASSTNRHNRQTFDLWAEIIIGKQTNIIGNWKQ